MRSVPHSIPPSLSEQLLAGWWLLPLKLHRHVLLLLAAGATCATCLFILFVGVLLHHTTNEPDTDLLPLAHRGADGRLDSGAKGLWEALKEGEYEVLKDASLRGRRHLQELPHSPHSAEFKSLSREVCGPPNSGAPSPSATAKITSCSPKKYLSRRRLYTTTYPPFVATYVSPSARIAPSGVSTSMCR